MPVIKGIKFEYRKTRFSTGIGWVVPSNEVYLSCDSAIDILCAKNIELFEKRYKNNICSFKYRKNVRRKQSLQGY